MKPRTGPVGAVEAHLSRATAEGSFEGILSLRERNKVRGCD
jgi:hypothetical protein